MSKNVWSILVILLSHSLLAQTATNPSSSAADTSGAALAATNPTPAEVAAPDSSTSSNQPAASAKKAPKKSTKKRTAKRKPAQTPPELRSVPLTAGSATVEANNVNVRGQAKLKSEVVTRLTKGQQVEVLEEIKLKDSGPDEPSAWAKILLPPGAHVWVNTGYLDPASQAVKPKRLNVRSGPGENYSVLARLERGETVKPVTTKGDWTEIEPPTNAVAFVAAQFLKQEAPGTAPAAPTAVTAADTNQPATTVADAQPVAPAPTDTAPPPAPPVAPVDASPATNAPTATDTASTTNAAAPEVTEEPPPPRIVQREGIVRGTVSIQAPTPYALISPDNGRLVDYLYTTAKDLDLSRWKGLRIIVTGEEGLDERWHNTPVITIQRIQVLDER